jgi:hypothetical protein
MDLAPESLADPADEGRRIVGLAGASGLDVRLLGGVAIACRCPSALRPPLSRAYKDIDFIANAKERPRVEELFKGAGYRPEEEFNTLHGHQRLFFWDPRAEREADVFLDSVSMCHTLDLRDRLSVDAETLPLADLLLLKLQVVEVNERDLKDAVALLRDHPVSAEGIDIDYIAEILGGDWGWWKTATLALERVSAYARELPDFDGADAVSERVKEILARAESTPKTRKWKMRARIGTRVRWYDVPDEALT